MDSTKILSHLRKSGYRITPQREMIVEAIANSEKHMSAEDVFAEVSHHTKAMNLATVYRTLEMLWEEGLVCRNDLGEGKIYYSVQEHGPHVHLVCRLCNRVIEGSPDLLEPIREILQTRYNFEADLNHISVFGICSNCGKSVDDRG